MCVVCTVFKESQYKQFVRPWSRILKRWGAKAFHATDFYNGADEFKRKTPQRQKWFSDDSKVIPNIVGENVHRVLIVAFRPKEFEETASQEWKTEFGCDTHAMAVQLCLIFNGWWLQEKVPTQYFAYFREIGDETDAMVDDAVRRLRKSSEYAPLIRVKSYTTVEKGQARGLEASDFVAWHWNKHAVERLDQGLEPRKDFLAFCKLTEDCGKVESAFITGKKLTKFFEVLARAKRDKLRETT